jgi:hypothetical protein
LVWTQIHAYYSKINIFLGIVSQKETIFALNLFYDMPFGKRLLCIYNGHAIAQAVSRWVPTAAARVRARVWQVGFVVGKVALGQVFSEYFDFSCQSSFHQILHHHNQPGQVQ